MHLKQQKWLEYTDLVAYQITINQVQRDKLDKQCFFTTTEPSIRQRRNKSFTKQNMKYSYLSNVIETKTRKTSCKIETKLKFKRHDTQSINTH